MENGKTDNTPYEFEIIQMFGVDTGMRVDLEGVVIMRGIFEQAVERVKHFVGKQEEEFSVFVC